MKTICILFEHAVQDQQACGCNEDVQKLSTEPSTDFVDGADADLW